MVWLTHSPDVVCSRLRDHALSYSKASSIRTLKQEMRFWRKRRQSTCQTPETAPPAVAGGPTAL
jgi:hypothetical protein